MNLTRTNETPKFPKLRGSMQRIIYPAIGEIKYDGEPQYCHISKDYHYLLNKHGLQRTCPNITAVLQEHLKGTECILIGELYCNEGKQTAIYDLLKDKSSDNLHFVIFDILSFSGNSLVHSDQMARKSLLKEIFLNFQSEHVHIIKFQELETREDADTFFLSTIKQGYEGVIIKNMRERFFALTSNWTKLKHKDQNDYKIAHIDPNNERIEITVQTPTGSKIVGVKATDEQKQVLQVGDNITIEHLGILGKGGLRNPVLLNN